MKALVNFQPLSFNTSGEYFLIWKQISTNPEGLRSKEAARPPPPLSAPLFPPTPRPRPCRVRGGEGGSSLQEGSELGDLYPEDPARGFWQGGVGSTPKGWTVSGHR